MLNGAIRRGDRRDLEAVILFADLRDFTVKAASWSIDQLLAALDTYYQALVDAITVAGGEVLKFMGDGLLAVFPIGEAQALARTCQRALAAVLAARNALEAANRVRAEAGADPLDFGVALHVGPVVYGNIGGQGRLDFTVIGPAVNLVSRVEGLCKALGQPLLATAAFARPLGGELVPAGEHRVRGLAEPVELFGCPKPWRRPADRPRMAPRRNRRQAMATALRHDLEAEMQALGERARSAALVLATTPRAAKDRALLAAAASLRARADEILEANAQGPRGGAGHAAFGPRCSIAWRSIARRVEAMAAGLEAVAALPDPVGLEMARWQRPNGLDIARVRVPLGVIGIIYEIAGPTSPPMPARSASRPAMPRSCAAARRASIPRARSSPACRRACARPACPRPRSRACRRPIGPRSASC